MTGRISFSKLRDTIAATLAANEKSYELPAVCEMLGLGPGGEGEAFRSKRVYVHTRLAAKSMQELIEIGGKLTERYPEDTELTQTMQVLTSDMGVAGDFKNIIFAADGPKPDIILSDALSNKIEIIENAEYCLVYDQPVGSSGLLWSNLVNWWANKNMLPFPDKDTERSLFLRLKKSLSSPPERIVFDTYYRIFHPRLKESLPALIPQVYLHFDPHTIAELQGNRRIPRQRMDFLILFSNSQRVVIEVDGKQHYADDDIASPKRYAEMVAEDRKLRLSGYEIYRFGGYELSDRNGIIVTERFFQKLFERHQIKES